MPTSQQQCLLHTVVLFVRVNGVRHHANVPGGGGARQPSPRVMLRGILHVQFRPVVHPGRVSEGVLMSILQLRHTPRSKCLVINLNL